MKCSELLLGEQVISEYDKSLKGEQMSHLTFPQYQQMGSEEENRIHNCVRQWAFKARECLPNDYGIFCLVISHLLKNAHHYFEMEKTVRVSKTSP